MTDIELKLAKPYAHNEDTSGKIKLEFAATFTDQDKALAFHQNLVQLIREAQS